MPYVVITGASSGIGYASALAFAGRNKDLILTARRKQKLEELKSTIHEINPNIDVVVFTADLSDSDEVRHLYARTKAYELETWINNAGFGEYASVAEQDLAKVENMLKLNDLAPTILSSLFVRDYAAKEGTQLINVSSDGGYTMVGNFVTYCATKFFVSAFTEGLAQELLAEGSPMRAKVLAPAVTETEFAHRAMNVETFDYKASFGQIHTPERVAQFLLDLYDSDKAVGLVNGETNQFELRDPLFPYITKG
ncbi:MULTISPECIES: SDR family NAD(P)-dependent oxidoreductase [unclassified Sporolactobacillus]|uniref:SDR family NAD(P)-dependent oxidoreductase n=1 Tax=unclassified Sporolactobacillus TaxID=2628533 RepID=UPI002367859E|nr:SDR family NAD(P)-dependent oxidoreductase [Sporolactobacillus sp. CQH2019]MDD9149988.1 SDR family NAD(P)-dependent oxidoreductase [Sporolactobacillus sp. CQH2019]